ncbi:MAG TPA: Ig-like domain-containing protein [Pantanalinema sp.]
MWTSTRGLLGASVLLVALLAGACTSDDAPVLTGTIVGGNGGATGRDEAPGDEGADPTPPPLQLPVLAALILVPDSFQLSSDPSAPASARSKALTVLARMSTGQQFQTGVTWQASPAGRVSLGGANTVSVVPGAPGGLVTLTASSGSITATASVLIVPRVLTVSGVSVSATTASLYVPDRNGGGLADLPPHMRLSATVTMSNGSTTSDVSWASTDQTVAQVDSAGYMAARGVGTAEIVATSTQDGARSARCVVTVTAKGIVDVALE